MFRLADMGLVWVPVELPQASEEAGGEPELVPVHLLMKLYNSDELADRDRDAMHRTTEGFLAKASEARTSAELLEAFDRVQDVRKEDREELQRRIADWSGIASGGESIAFSGDHLTALLRFDFVFNPVRRALFNASREGVRKN